jgi:MtN3 and saliva related transmembrane protein
MEAAMSFSETVGLVAGALTTVSFVPQVIKTWRTRSAGDFSLPMLLLFVAGIALWLAYGLMAQAWPVIYANAITLVLSAYILVVKLRRG